MIRSENILNRKESGEEKEEEEEKESDIVLEKKSKLCPKGLNTEQLHSLRYPHQADLNFYNLIDSLEGTKGGRGTGRERGRNKGRKKGRMKSTIFW